MHIPGPYQENRRDVLVAAIEARSLGTLISVSAEGIQLSHIPFAIQMDGDRVELIAHVARSNPQWRTLAEGSEAVASFLVDDAYVSPTWYPSKQESGRVVPTWAYVAVEARGPAEIVETPSELLAIVDTLTRRHERGRAAPWSTSDAPTKFIGALLRGIVGIRIRVHALVGAWKLDQSMSDADRDGAAQGMLEVDGKAAMAAHMRGQ